METTYTENLSTSFPNGLNTSQFATQIITDSSITETLLRIDTDNTNAYIVFNNPLTTDEQSALSTLISNYTYIGPPTILQPYINSSSNLITCNINNIPTTYIGDQMNEIHISKEPQGHFSSIQAAITAHPAQNMVFIVHPGTYIENNPIVLNQGCVLEGEGSAENTFIVAQNPNSDLVTLGINCRIESLTLTGANGTGARGIYFNGTQSGGRGLLSAVMECFVVNCDIGIESDGQNIVSSGGAADTIYARECIISSTTQQLDKGVYIHSSGEFIGVAIIVSGIPATPVPTPAVPITYAYYSADPNSKISMSLSSCYYCTNGLYLDNNSNSEIALLTAKYNYNGINIGPNGTQTRLSISSLESSGSGNYDLMVNPTNAIIEVHSGVMDDTLIYNPNGVILNMYYHTALNGLSRQHLTGTICMGTVNEASELFIGEGYYDIYTGSIFQNTISSETGTFTDITALSVSSTNFNLFLGTTVDNCIYIGRTQVPVGIMISIVTATTSIAPTSSLEWTYWNGTTWVPFSIMQTIDIAPYYYMGNSFISQVDTYQIRFGLNSQSPLVAKTINGVSKNWVRIRIISVIPSIPVINSIYLHTNSSHFNNNGFQEFFGDARTIKTIPWDITNMSVCTNSANQTVYYSQKLGMQLTGNKFASGVESCIARTVLIPTDIDNSFPVKFKFAFIGDSNTAGNVQFIVRYNFSNIGSNVYFNQGDAPTTSPNEQTTSAIVTITAANTKYRSELSLDLSNIDVNPCDGRAQLMWVSIERDASGDNSNDTYGGNIAIVQMTPYYISWIDGGHILSY